VLAAVVSEGASCALLEVPAPGHRRALLVSGPEPTRTAPRKDGSARGVVARQAVRPQIMATEGGGGDGHQSAQGPGRRGAVRQRSQFLAPNGNWAKRGVRTGRIMDHKQDGTAFKGVRREK
jgi:hypothetical protein